MSNTIYGIDGGENYETSVWPTVTDISAPMASGPWASASGVSLSASARTGSYAFRLNAPTSNMRRVVFNDNDDPVVGVAFGVNMPSLPSILNNQWAVVRFLNIFGNTIASVQLAPTGQIVIKDYSGTILSTSSRSVAAGVFNHADVQFEAGSGVSVRVNGKDSFVTAASWPTKSLDDKGDLVTIPAALYSFGSWSGSDSPMVTNGILMDDFAFYTSDGTIGTGWLGLYGVYYLKPITDAHYTAWSKSTGSSAYALINEVKPDGDSAFIYTDTNGNKSSFTVEALPTNITDVAAVAPTMYARKTDSGPGSVQLGLRQGSTDAFNGDDLALLTDYGYQSAVFQTDAGGGAFDPTTLPQIIIERTE